MKSLWRALLALLLLPLCYGVLQSLLTIGRQFMNVPEGSFYFFGGLFGYLAFQWVFFRPIRTYVFGHEVTHALAAWMSGGDVKDFHVSKKGGSVSVTKSNWFVSLAPYMIPLYSMILLGAYDAAGYFYDLHRWWHWFLALLGMSVGFHAALTLYALKHDQPDLQAAGVFLSSVLIYLGNACCIVLLLGLLFPKTVSWKAFFKTAGRESVTAYRRAGRGAFWAGSHAYRFVYDMAHRTPA